MATARKYGDKYRAFWQENGRTASSRTDDYGNPFTRKKDAEEYGTEREVKYRLGLAQAAAEPPPTTPTVAEWFARWWPGQDLGLKTTGNYLYIFTVYVIPEWGHCRLDEITHSEINAWEQRLIAAGYERAGVPTAARTRLCTLLGDAVTEGLIDSNPALRQRNRGRRSGVGTGGRGVERQWCRPLDALLFAERVAIMSGRCEDFVLALLIAWTGMRWGEAVGLLRSKVALRRLRVDWQLSEIKGKFYLLPPKDDSNRWIDLPPFLSELLLWLMRQHPDRRCVCKPVKILGQKEQPCEGDGLFVFLTHRGRHLRNSNYSTRYVRPAADGQYPAEESKGVAARPVLVDASTWPGTPLPPWPAAERGVEFVSPPLRGYQRKPLGLGINAASSRSDLVAYALGHGVPDAELWTRDQILDRFVRSSYVTESTPLASWAPLIEGAWHEGLRHGHATWLALPEIGTDGKLRDERMGHIPKGGMRDHYTDITEAARTRLRAGLQQLWLEALAVRAWYSLRSPVALLDEQLEPFRAGLREPVSPVRREAEVFELRAVSNH